MRSLKRQLKIDSLKTRYLLALVACWIASRWVYFSYFGIRFDASPLNYFLQFIDPSLLKTALLQSVFYLRDQPPGFNLFLGFVLKGFEHPDAAFRLIYQIIGLGSAIILFCCLVRIAVHPGLAFIISCFFSLSPITVMYENTLFYTYPLTFLLSVAALLLHRYLTNGRTADAAVFFLTLALIVLTRGIFHVGWFLIILLALLLAPVANRRQISVAA